MVAYENFKIFIIIHFSRILNFYQIQSRILSYRYLNYSEISKTCYVLKQTVILSHVNQESFSI